MTSHLLFVTGNDSESIVQRLMKLKNDRTYTELYVSMIKLDSRISNAIVDVLRDESRTWDGIHLAHCTGNVDSVISNALQVGNLKKMSLLPDGHRMNDACLYALAEGLKANQTVKSLVLRVDLYNELATALAEGLSANSALEELSLILSTSDANAIDTLAKGIQYNSNLQSLKLNRCSLEDGQVAALVRALENHPSLQELTVQGSNCRASGIIAISGLLQSNNKKPFKLDLSNQDFGNQTFGICFLAPALPDNKSMRFLDLSSNHLTDVDVTCVASALSENSTLEELKLVNCNLTDKGAKIIASKLPRMTGLKTLWLQNNPLSKAGAQSLLDAVRTNMHLEQLILPHGKKLNGFQQRIDQYLMLNKAGRRLLDDPNLFQIGLWPHVFERINDMDWREFSGSNKTDDPRSAVTYWLLKNGPVLFAR